MAFVRKIKRGNRVYLAEVENYRDGAKVKQRLIKYIGLDPSCAKDDIKFKYSDLKVENVKIYGPVIALESIARELDLYGLLGHHAAPILALVFGHCLDYRSVTDAKCWYETTDLPVLMGSPEISINTIHSGLEALAKADASFIQKSIFEKMCEILGEDSSGVVYDATNTHLAGRRSELANKGKDKEGVRGRKLIQIGLGITRELGIPIFHHVREGNIHDTKMFREAIYQFNCMGIRRGLMVFDRGITSKTCISNLSNTGWKSLAGVPMHKGIKSVISELDFSKLQNFRNLVIQGDTEFFVKPIKFAIGGVPGRLFILQNTKKKQDVERFRRYRIHHTADYIKSNSSAIPDELLEFFDVKNRINWHAVKRAEKYDGLSFLFTDAKMSVREAVKLYFAKDLIEQCFKLEKSILKLRPISFWLDSKIKSHVLICHIALALLTTSRIRLQNQGVTSDICGIFRKLNSIYKVYFSINKKNHDEKCNFDQVNTMSNDQQKILRIMAPKLKM